MTGANAIEIGGEMALLDRRGALVFPDLRLLVVSDLHLEKGAAFARRGMFLPPYDTAATLAMLAAVIAEHDPRTVISLGDSFHDRKGSDHMPEPYRQALGSIAAGRDWLWVAGNHDPEPPVGVPGTAVGEIAMGRLTFRHEPARTGAEGEIAGHLHPGARIVQRGRSVRRPCFAFDGRRLVMPAFGSLTGHMNILDRSLAAMFDWPRFTAFMLGNERLYAMPHARLVGW